MLGLVYHPRDREANQFFIDRLFKRASVKGLTPRILAPRSAITQLGAGDTAVVRTRDPLLAQTLESHGVRVVNPSPLARLGNDKLCLATWCQTHDIAHPRTKPASQWWRNPDRDTVLKPRYGHGGHGVSRNQMPLLAGTDYWIIQTYLPEACTDYRSWILGRAPFATLMRTARPGDFRTNVSTGATARVACIPPEVSDLAKRVAGLLPEGYYGIDITVGPHGPVVIEIEDTVGARSLYALNVCDPASLVIDWIASTTAPGERHPLRR